jgi:ABC-type Fe3+ transport system permease subunit
MIFGFGLLAKIVPAWTLVFLIVFPDLIHSARFLGASERQVMRTIIVPSANAADKMVALAVWRPENRKRA